MPRPLTSALASAAAILAARRPQKIRLTHTEADQADIQALQPEDHTRTESVVCDREYSLAETRQRCAYGLSSQACPGQQNRATNAADNIACHKVISVCRYCTMDLRAVRLETIITSSTTPVMTLAAPPSP